MNDKFKSHIPLLLLTFSVIISAGFICGSLISYFHEGEIKNYLVYIALAAQLAGVVLSLNHIHQKKNLPRFFNGFTHSFLSIESIFLNIFLAMLFLLSLSIYFQYNDYSPLLLYISSATGLVLVFIIAQLYNLSSQIVWSGLLSFVSPIVNFATLSLLVSRSNTSFEITEQWLFAFLLIDLLTAFLRQKKYDSIFEQLKKINFQADNKVIKILYFCRAFINICIFALYIEKYFTAMLVLYICVILLDRIIFYLSGIQKSPEMSVQAERSIRLNSGLKDN